MAAIATIPITTAVTGATTAPVGLGTGAAAALIVITDLVYGSGGTSGVVYVQTSLDGGVNWVDLVNMTFATASKKRLHNLTASPITTPYTATDGALASDSAHDGILGTLYRTKLTSLGTFSATTLTVTAIPGKG